MIRYDKGRSGLKWRALSHKQRAEWIVTHPILQRMAKLIANMFVEEKTPSLVMTPHQQISLTQWKLLMHPLISRNIKMRRRGGEKFMLKTDISYCVRLIVMTTHLHCPCIMLSMAELSVKMSIHTTAFGTIKMKSLICSLPQVFYTSIKTKTGFTRGAEAGSQIRWTNCLLHGFPL